MVEFENRPSPAEAETSRDDPGMALVGEGRSGAYFSYVRTGSAEIRHSQAGLT
jgi:hypothetical protein